VHADPVPPSRAGADRMRVWYGRPVAPSGGTKMIKQTKRAVTNWLQRADRQQSFVPGGSWRSTLRLRHPSLAWQGVTMQEVTMKPILLTLSLLMCLLTLSALAAAAPLTIVADPTDTEVFGSGGVGIGFGGGAPELWDWGVGDTGAGSPNLGRRAIIKFDLSGL